MSENKAVQIIDEFLEVYPYARWGPGHVVFDDHNLEDSSIEFCLKACDEPPEFGLDDELGQPDMIDSSRVTLKKLLEIPETERVYY